MRSVRLRELNVGCLGGGTGLPSLPGLPSLIGGLKHNPWVHVHAVVTMFDSGGSSGQLRDQLGVLPPGDILKCVLALAQNEDEARRILLSRLPGLENGRLSGHTSGNLLLSMMAQYGGDFLAAVDSLRALLGCHGRVWPVSVEHASVCAEYGDGSTTTGEVAVDQGQSQGLQIKRIWLEPEVGIHPSVADAIRGFDAVIIGPGSFYTSLMPILLVRGVAEALRAVKGPILLVTNILTEGRGMHGFTAADAVTQVGEAVGRPVDVVLVNSGVPSDDVLDQYASEHKELLAVDDVPDGCEVIHRAVLARADRAACASAAVLRRLECAGRPVAHCLGGAAPRTPARHAVPDVVLSAAFSERGFFGLRSRSSPSSAVSPTPPFPSPAARLSIRAAYPRQGYRRSCLRS